LAHRSEDLEERVDIGSTMAVTEGVEDQEVSYLYQAFFLWLDPPAERKKNFTFFLSEREDWGNPIDCCFLQTSGKEKARMVRSLRHPRMKGAIS